MKKLPLRDLVVASFRRFFRSFDYAWRISWLWLILFLGMVLVSGYPELEWPDTAGDRLIGVTRFGLYCFALALALASIAVLWHRMILLDEKRDAPFAFRLDRLVWLYFVYGLIVAIPLFLASLATLALDLFTGALFVVALALDLMLIVALMVVSLRLSLVLPAVALGEDLGLSEAWRVTEGNGLALVGATVIIVILTSLIVLVPYLLVELFGSPVASGFSQLVIGAFEVLADIVAGLVTVTSLSLAYGFLVKDQPIES